MPYQVAVIGGVAVGKSSLLQKLGSRNKHIFTCPEPKEKWTHVQSITSRQVFDFLNEFWNKELSPFDFQVHVHTTVIENLAEKYAVYQKPGYSVFVTEQSVFDQLEVFAKSFLDDGYISIRQLTILHSLRKSLLLINPKIGQPDMIIFLDCQPETQHLRCLQRNHQSEKSITVDQIKQINDRYKSWFYNEISGNVKCLVIDADKGEEFVYNEVKKAIDSFC